MPLERFELSRVPPYAPQAHVSTIPPQWHTDKVYYTLHCYEIQVRTWCRRRDSNPYTPSGVRRFKLRMSTIPSLRRSTGGETPMLYRFVRTLLYSLIRLCCVPLCFFLERTVGFEPTTSTLGRLRSTAELCPHGIWRRERDLNSRRVLCLVRLPTGCLRPDSAISPQNQSLDPFFFGTDREIRTPKGLFCPTRV